MDWLGFGVVYDESGFLLCLWLILIGVKIVENWRKVVKKEEDLY